LKTITIQGAKKDEARRKGETLTKKTATMEDKLADAFGDDDREVILREEAELQGMDYYDEHGLFTRDYVLINC
jgi:hypothetical protein